MTPAKTNRRLSLGALGQIPDGQNERSEGRWRPGVEGEVECPWHGMLHLTSCLSSWVRGFLMDLLRLCQGGGEEILGWGALCAPALPTSQQSPFLQRHALERGQGILIPGSPLSRSTARSKESRSGSGVCRSSAVAGGSLAQRDWRCSGAKAVTPPVRVPEK